MSKVIGIAGSLRRGSLNLRLLRAAVELAPESLQLELESIRGIPLYDGDLEQASGVPQPARLLKDRIAAAAGLLLVTPEYNGSIPGPFKNAFDWLSRPASDVPRVFGGKPVGLIGATPGRGGTRSAQTAWLPVLRNLGTRPYWGHSLYVGGAQQIFDDSGALTDPKVRELLTAYLAGFAQFIAAKQ